jgi:hypothetical protein
MNLVICWTGFHLDMAISVVPYMSLVDIMLEDENERDYATYTDEIASISLVSAPSYTQIALTPASRLVILLPMLKLEMGNPQLM